MKPYVSQNSWLHVVHQCINRPFSARKELPVAKQCIQFLAIEAWWAKSATNWKLVWLVLIYKLGFPRSNCQVFFCRGFNRRFCFFTRWFSSIISFSSFFRKFERHKLPIGMYMYNAFLLKLCFARATGCISPSTCQSVFYFEYFWKEKLQVLFLSTETRLTDVFKNSLCMWFFLWFQTLPKLPTGLLPPRSQWTFLSVYKVTRSTCCEVFFCIRNLIFWNWQNCNF